MHPLPDVEFDAGAIRTFACDGADCPHRAGYRVTWRFLDYRDRLLPVREGNLCAECLNLYRGFKHGRGMILAVFPLY